MAEGNNNASQGRQHNGGRKPGSGRPGYRGGGRYSQHGNGGNRQHRGYQPRHRDGQGGDGERRHDGVRYGSGDGERRYNGDGRRGGQRGDRAFHHGNGQGNRSGYRHANGRRDHEERRDGNPRYRDNRGERYEHNDRNDRHEYRGKGQGNRDGYRSRNDRGDFRGGNRDNAHGGRDGYRGNNHGGNRDGYRGGQRGEQGRGDARHTRHQDAERREFTPQEKREYREAKRGEYMSKPRRNSDGTMSFPSQNPYTNRRPDEPKMPKGLEWSMLSKDERERLRGLSKEHAENIGLHILAAYAQEENDPKNALEHAKWAAHQASRIDFARETLAFVAYRQGDYKLAMREFRTAYRMNGFLDYLPFIADCERGVGSPKKAIEIALSDDAKQLRGEAKAEMFLVYAGALGDLEHWDKAVEIVHTLGRSKGLSGAYRMRAVQAEQFFLEQAGRTDEAMALDGLLDRLEMQYADVDEDESDDDVVIDYDLQTMSEDVMDDLGISEDEAAFAPEDEHDDADGETAGTDAAVDGDVADGESAAGGTGDGDAGGSGDESDDEPAGDVEGDAMSADADAETNDDGASADADDDAPMSIQEEYERILAEAGIDDESDDDADAEDAAPVNVQEGDADQADAVDATDSADADVAVDADNADDVAGDSATAASADGETEDVAVADDEFADDEEAAASSDQPTPDDGQGDDMAASAESDEA